MIKINLVREGRAAVRGTTAGPASAAVTGPSNLNGLLIVGLLILGVLAAGGYWFVRWSALKDKQAEVALRRAEAEKLEAIIKEVEEFQARKENLEQRIALINDLKRNQKNPVKIMDRISQDLPDLVWLDRMSLEGSRISIDGRALNPNAIANFVANLKADPLFNEPSVREVRRTATRGVNVFGYKMIIDIKAPPPPPPTETPAGEEGTTGKPGGAAKSKGTAQGA